MPPFGGQDDAIRDPWGPRNNPADWPDEERLRYEDLQRHEEGILLLKVFEVERISKTTNCLIKIWKIIAVGKNMEFYRFRIFEYLNYQIFEFSDYQYQPSKIYYLQKRHYLQLLPLRKVRYILMLFLQVQVNFCLQKLVFDSTLDDLVDEKILFGVFWNLRRQREARDQLKRLKKERKEREDKERKDREDGAPGSRAQRVGNPVT